MFRAQFKFMSRGLNYGFIIELNNVLYILYEITSEPNLINVSFETGTMQILWSFVNKGFPYAILQVFWGGINYMQD